MEPTNIEDDIDEHINVPKWTNFFTLKDSVDISDETLFFYIPVSGDSVLWYCGDDIGGDVLGMWLRGRVNEPKQCGRQECLAVNSMTLIHNRCRLDSHQGTSIMVNKASLRVRELEVNQVIFSFIITMNNYLKSFLEGIQTHFGLEASQSGINLLATPKRINLNRGTQLNIRSKDLMRIGRTLEVVMVVLLELEHGNTTFDYQPS
ncbi:hypothetical protein GIB67_027649 [Kingdonia uniflora]|uniref:DNA helicase n=1 Tax=Kingdonia uniflora TaxID=39325 RepID=A0A7J7NKU0_9MAGN|nr:hypothetical protein GIB67_027649 [Kingdonia uniflora]